MPPAIIKGLFFTPFKIVVAMVTTLNSRAAGLCESEAQNQMKSQITGSLYGFQCKLEAFPYRVLGDGYVPRGS